MNRVMIDVEALAVKSPNAAILEIAVYPFDVDGFGSGDCWAVCPDQTHPDLWGARERVSLDWHEERGTYPLDEIQRRGRVPLRRALNELTTFLVRADEVWAKGPEYDLRILQAAFFRHGMEWPLHYRQSRCVRTFVEMAGLFGFSWNWRHAHNAMEDAIDQANAVCAAHIFLSQKIGDSE